MFKKIDNTIHDYHPDWKFCLSNARLLNSLFKIVVLKYYLNNNYIMDSKKEAEFKIKKNIIVNFNMVEEILNNNYKVSIYFGEKIEELFSKKQLKLLF